FALTVKAKMKKAPPSADILDFPDMYDGVRGMQFIETVVESGWSDGPKWIKWRE
ncbi:MAG TPA: oxidoreductase, partial [Porphyromonadaceae bacterium]|nr:oxidoreductase [Porphyromonadaceae bacterium]